MFKVGNMTYYHHCNAFVTPDRVLNQLLRTILCGDDIMTTQQEHHSTVPFKMSSSSGAYTESSSVQVESSQKRRDNELPWGWEALDWH